MHSSPRKLGILVLVPVALAGLSACDAVEPSSTPEAPPEPAPPPVAAPHAKLIATVKHRSGNEFLFYAGETMMKVLEKGKYPSQPVDLQLPSSSRSTADLYRFLVPGERVPDELQAASDRFEAAKLWGPRRRSDEVKSPVTQAAGRLLWDDRGTAPAQGSEFDSLCPMNWFKSWACANPMFPLDVCWLRKKGSGWFANNDIHRFQASACCYRGAVATTLWFDDCSDLFCFVTIEQTITAALAPGQWVNQVTLHGSNGWDYDASFSITAGTGGFHAAGIIDD